MRKILFLIHDLGQGGAEKVLVNLVNNLDKARFDVSLVAVFGGGVNEQFLGSDVHFRTIFPKIIPGNSKWMKLFTPKFLHYICVRGKYDIEISYLEGPSARIVSGCSTKDTKLVSWIHVEQHTMKKVAKAFRNENEARNCYNRFEQTICVSQYVKNDFCSLLDFKKPCKVLYNTVESDKIMNLSKEIVEFNDSGDKLRLIAVGTLKKSKGYERLIRVISKLVNEKYPIHLYILGIGPLQQAIESQIEECGLTNCVTLLGYQTNPYKYVAKCDLFVCTSYAEGFSTAVTESLIVGTPVCTVEVSGMKELLGDDNEYGVVTDNSEDAFYQGVKSLLDNPELLTYYKKQAGLRGISFQTEETVKAVEEMLMDL